MLGAWPIAYRWKYLATSVRAWKLPDSTYSHCSALWTAWIFLQRRFRRASYGNSLKRMPIMQRPFGRSTSLREVWIAALCSAIPLPHWTSLPSACAQFRKQLPARVYPTLEQLERTLRKKLNSKGPTTWCQAEIPKTFKHPQLWVPLGTPARVWRLATPASTGTSACQIQTVPDPEIRSCRTRHELGSATHSIPRGSPRREQAERRYVHPEPTRHRIDERIRLLFRTSTPESVRVE